MPRLVSGLAGVSALVRQVFQNRELRRVELAFVGFNVAEWGTWIAILVFAYRAGGTTTAGVVGMVQLVPAALFAPAASLLGDRYPRDRVLLWGYVTEAICMGATAISLLAGSPQIVSYALATATATSITLTRPVQGALLPSLSRTPEELIAANVVGGWIESVSLFAGPLLTGVLLGISSPGTVFAVMAAILLLSALTVRALSPHRVAVTTDAPEQSPGVADELLGGFRALARQPHPRLVVSLMGAHFVLIGALDLLLVVLGIRLLGLGNAGVGYLNSAWGVGGLVGAAATFALVSRRRLAPALIAGALAWGLALGLIGVAPSRAAAFVLLLLAGAGRPLIDVAGRTLLQRVVADRVLSRVFGVLEGVAMGGQGLGLAVAPILFATLGDRGTFVAAGTFLPVTMLLAWRSLSSMDTMAIPLERIALLRSLALFSPLSAPVLERIATQLIPVEAAAGAVVIRQGDRGDRFYVIVDGEVGVSIDGLPVRSMGPGDFFGEIALLRDIPRTAGCTTLTDTHLFALERTDFLEAVTGHSGSVRAANEVVAARLA
jgi:MFS family permease